MYPQSSADLKHCGLALDTSLSAAWRETPKSALARMSEKLPPLSTLKQANYSRPKISLGVFLQTTKKHYYGRFLLNPGMQVSRQASLFWSRLKDHVDWPAEPE
eukprot:scpid98737/ scgid34355/ 